MMYPQGGLYVTVITVHLILQTGLSSVLDRVMGVGATGGSVTQTPSVWTNAAGTGIQVAGTALTIDQMPSHSHALLIYTGGESAGGKCDSYGGRAYIQGDTCLPTGGNQPHYHGVTDHGHAHTAGASAIDVRPPYYALAFIMKL